MRYGVSTQETQLALSALTSIDSALHILSGCKYTQIRNMITERHNLACSMIFKAISKSCFVSMDIGSSEWLAMQNFHIIPDSAELGLSHSESFHPASQTKIGLPPAVRMLPSKQSSLEWQGAIEGDWEHLSSTASHQYSHQPQTAPT